MGVSKKKKKPDLTYYIPYAAPTFFRYRDGIPIIGSDLAEGKKGGKEKKGLQKPFLYLAEHIKQQNRTLCVSITTDLRDPQIHSSCIATNIKVEPLLLHALFARIGQITGHLL